MRTQCRNPLGGNEYSDIGRLERSSVRLTTKVVGFCFGLTLLVQALGVDAFAQPKPAARVNPSHRQAALELLTVTNVGKNLSQLINQVLDAQIRQNPNLAPYRNILENFYNKYMSFDSLKEDIVQLYVSEFSEQELRETADFYRSGTGQKIIAKLPALMQKGNEMGMKRVQDHLPELADAIKREAETLKKVAPPPPAQGTPGAGQPRNAPAAGSSR